jgi:2-isopropylmalate synthase
VAHVPLPLDTDVSRAVDLYDTTLRDGTQRPGISLTVDDKLTIARRMDTLGVRFIEGGWPGANPKDTEFFARATAGGELPLVNATLVAFGMTRGPNRSVEQDVLLNALLDAGTSHITLVGKSWGYHVDEALQVSREENLAMVTSSIAYLRDHGRTVFFDAEHYFDGHRRDGAYAREVIAAAASAGAETVVLCDTNGGTMPWEVATVVDDQVAAMAALGATIGLHFHDDGGCAVANTLLGVEAGGLQVQGTANGIGERCGNANLFTITADLQLKRGLQLVAPAELERLVDLSHHIAELINDSPPRSQPYVGTSAFAHKAGLHASALAKAPDMYNHIEPAQVGNEMHMLVSELAGRSNVVLKARAFGLEITADQAAQVLAEVKRRAQDGWTYEAADASFELMLRRTLGLMGDEPFHTQHFRVSVGGGRARSGEAAGADAPAESPAEAILAVHIGGKRRLGAGEGNGPVDALDHAFRSAINGSFGSLDAVHLVDFRVRVLDTSSGTDAVTRVLVTATDGRSSWTTVGVHPNIVEASWKALSDAYTYAIVRDRWKA